jgi:heat shock protein HspQ
MCDNSITDLQQGIEQMIRQAKFHIGQIVEHNKFDYRGVIFEVDPVFAQSEEWYQQVARSRPPKDEPWYHVLVDNATHTTYVAERHLEAAADLSAVNHPAINEYFSAYRDGKYISRQPTM